MCIRCVPYGICCSCRNCSMKRVKSTQHTKKEHRKRITRMREIEMQIERNRKTDSNGSGSGSDDDKIQTDGYEEFRLAIYSSQMNYNVRDLLRWRVFEMSAFVRVLVCLCLHYFVWTSQMTGILWRMGEGEGERERTRTEASERKRKSKDIFTAETWSQWLEWRNREVGRGAAQRPIISISRMFVKPKPPNWNYTNTRKHIWASECVCVCW